MMNKQNKTLLIGPWVGEFGWELFTWQGYARKIVNEYFNYDHVIVISKSGHKFLYNDFCDEFISFDLPNGVFSDSWFCRDVNMKVINSDFTFNIINNIKFDDRLNPNKITNGMFLLPGNGIAKINPSFYNQEYIKYKSNTIDLYFDLVFHPRNKGVGDSRNWDINKWQNLVDSLKDKFSIAVIGNNEAFKLNNVNDFRNVSIEDTVSILNRSKLIVGQSSGPLHLASLCGTPQLVWSTEHNRVRYEKHWNPFKTPVYFYSDMAWNPTVGFIHQKIMEIMK